MGVGCLRGTPRVETVNDHVHLLFSRIYPFGETRMHGPRGMVLLTGTDVGRVRNSGSQTWHAGSYSNFWRDGPHQTVLRSVGFEYNMMSMRGPCSMINRCPLPS